MNERLPSPLASVIHRTIWAEHSTLPPNLYWLKQDLIQRPRAEPTNQQQEVDTVE